MLERVRSITDEAFETARDAVIVQYTERDKNMQEDFSRASAEITKSKFNWNRQETECTLLKEGISKQEWKTYFEALFGSNARRLDLRYNSKAHAEQEAAFV